VPSGLLAASRSNPNLRHGVCADGQLDPRSKRNAARRIRGMIFFDIRGVSSE
jgi:hypothetical protein